MCGPHEMYVCYMCCICYVCCICDSCVVSYLCGGIVMCVLDFRMCYCICVYVCIYVCDVECVCFDYMCVCTV